MRDNRANRANVSDEPQAMTIGPRNQVEALEKELQNANQVIKDQQEELLSLYRRLDLEKRSY